MSGLTRNKFKLSDFFFHQSKPAQTLLLLDDLHYNILEAASFHIKIYSPFSPSSS